MRPGYFVEKALHGFRQSLFVNLLTTATIAMALLIASAVLLLLTNAESIARSWSRGLRVSIYLKDTAGPSERERIASVFRTNPSVKTVRILTPEAALAEFKAELAGQRSLLAGVEDDVLPASVELLLRDDAAPSAPNEIAKEIRGDPAVDDVEYGQGWIDRLAQLGRGFRVAAIAAGIFIFIATTFIVSSTIRLAVYARRDEIEIMKLVGATDLFVRLPFIIEGMMEGLLAALLATMALLVLHRTLFSQLVAKLAVGEVELAFLPTATVGWLVLSGVLLGAGGAALALGRFLRV